jgi:signal transduction histidine kinase
MDEAEARQSTEELRKLTRGALAEMRTLLFELRPAALSQARLCDLLRQLSEALMGRTHLPIYLHVEGDCEIPSDVKVEMYRIAQETLNNVVKYACATEVEIHVLLEPDRVHLEIKDNGVGFDPTCIKPTSLGLHIMRERAEAIQAQLQVASQPGLGTTISLDWHK